MQDLAVDLGFSAASLTPLEASARLLAALACGALIGVDREMRERPAGLRTHMLVALAACLFTILTFEMVHRAVDGNPSLGVDPVRVVEALTSGVAFLAAGTIIISKGDVRGLTTGASLWLSGAAGLATGMGLYWLAYLVTGAALIVLVVVQMLKGLAARGTRKHEAATADELHKTTLHAHEKGGPSGGRPH
ncbi:MgtC/SapB family protein [Maricaulis sp. CAU 1757]